MSTKCHMIVQKADGRYGAVEVSLNSERYDADKVEGDYASVQETILTHSFGPNGFKIHSSIDGHR